MTGRREQRRQISNPTLFGKVAVLFGGTSSERDVSLETGRAVHRALVDRGIDAVLWDPAERGVEGLHEQRIDRAWIALHGTGGEDGAIQGALQWLQIPYTGSGVMASALAMDKDRSKRLFAAAGIPTPAYEIIRSKAEAAHVAEEMGFPLIFKPSCEGSSVGMSKAFDASDVAEAAKTALAYGDVAIVERFDRCGKRVFDDRLDLSPLALDARCRVFYDYRAKYESDRTQYHCPGTTSDIAEAKFADLALKAFELLGCRGWGRVDFMADSDGQPQVLEVNTVPGMTSHSLVPMAAKAAGIDFGELCWRILETSVDSGARTEKEVANGA